MSITWNNITGTGGGTTNMVANNGYIQNTTSAPQSFLIPSTVAVGDEFEVLGFDSTGGVGVPIITQNSGQIIYFTDVDGNLSSTTRGSTGQYYTGAGGSGSSTMASVKLVCVTTNTDFYVTDYTNYPVLL